MTDKEEAAIKVSELKDKLFWEPRRVWDALSDDDKTRVTEYAEGYKRFLDAGRTERRCAAELARLAEEAGFSSIDASACAAGKVYRSERGKLFVMAVPGQKPLTEGARLITSHIDCPRLDLKPNPLYEDASLAYLKTHYYGGVKKYQWVSRPLALVGSIILGNGERLDIEIGLKPGDPVLTIPDLLPHLGRKQMEMKASEFIPGENLNLVVGGLPYADKEADQRVKLAIMELLFDRYGMTEQDFTSAEIQVVPADSARDAGFDRSFIASYGQDDRVCAYTSFTAVRETNDPEYTSVVVFYDKEEIGSEGATGAQSRFLENFLLDYMELNGITPSVRNLNRVFARSKAFSADVNAGFDPNYPEVFEKRNACKLGFGVVIEKYTGHGGKYMASDADAEFAGWVRNLFNASGVVWQTGGLGKIDEGGGGTVAKYLARTGIEIIDVGPAILGMHSPLELTAKDDVWMCHKGFAAFLAA
jgi:aspartyl aminopeptidase